MKWKVLGGDVSVVGGGVVVLLPLLCVFSYKMSQKKVKDGDKLYHFINMIYLSILILCCYYIYELQNGEGRTAFIDNF